MSYKKLSCSPGKEHKLSVNLWLRAIPSTLPAVSCETSDGVTDYISALESADCSLLLIKSGFIAAAAFRLGAITFVPFPNYWQRGVRFS